MFAVLSAAALRRRLLEKRASATVAAPLQDNTPSPSENGTGSPSDSGIDGGDSKRKGLIRPSARKDVSRTPEQVLLGKSGTFVEDEYETTEPVDEPPKRKAVQLSSINLTKSKLQRKDDGTAVLNFPDSSEVLIPLPPARYSVADCQKRLVLLGSYGVKVKSGEVSIYGASLYSSDTIQWVHAPHCHALPVLRCSEKSVLELHPHPGASQLRNMERLSQVFGNLWNEASSGAVAQTWQILPSSADGPKKAILQDLKSPAVWNRKIAELVTTKPENVPMLLVCGPKSSGKSTFTRIVTNKLVTDRAGSKKRKWPGVAVLDIDPGQPEFSPPGVISLVTLDGPNLSPPFCHPTLGDKNTVRSHTVASITPAANLEHYKSCVLDLLSHYKAEYTKYPLIINTPGWIQGSGLILLQDLILDLRPTELLYMSEDGPEDTVAGLKSVCGGASFTNLPSQSSEFTSRTALHLRHMQTMSYFHKDAAHSSNVGIRWNSTPLALVPPLLVSYSGVDSGLFGIVCYGYQPDPELLLEAIDGTILAIVEIEDHRAFGTLCTNGEVGPKLENLVQRTPERIPYIRSEVPLDPRYAQCLGLALIRGIDTKHNLLALSTPLSAGQLEGKTIVLVSGKFDPPTWAYTEEHYNRAFRKGDEDVIDEGVFRDIPWTERLHGSQKRSVGSKVWRVRRDLGRNNAAAGD